MSTFLVTGASGFLGTEICKELIARGHQTIGTVFSERNAQVFMKNLPEVKTYLIDLSTDFISDHYSIEAEQVNAAKDRRCVFTLVQPSEGQSLQGALAYHIDRVSQPDVLVIGFVGVSPFRSRCLRPAPVVRT